MNPRRRRSRERLASRSAASDCWSTLPWVDMGCASNTGGVGCFADPPRFASAAAAFRIARRRVSHPPLLQSLVDIVATIDRYRFEVVVRPTGASGVRP